MPLCYPKDRPATISTGPSDYRKLREAGYVYVDKTTFIADVLVDGVEALVIPRPRRFGKTLNMSTLRYFLELKKDEDLTHLFEDTAIWEAKDPRGERYKENHFQAYPVVYLTFKEVKAGTWEESSDDIRELLQDEIARLIERYGAPSPTDRRGAQVLELMKPNISMGTLKKTLKRLVFWLESVTERHVVLLVDEYDAPLHAAHQHGYWDDAILFFGPFLSAGYKDRELLHRGVITGILKVAKENIFSDLNNPTVCTILDHPSHDAFGFTQTEVEELVALAGPVAHLATIQRWYNGYQFGDEELGRTTIYNPWSVLQHLSSGKRVPGPYWIGTSGNVLIRDLLKGQAARHGDQVEALLRGETIATELDNNLELRRIQRSETALWSLLLFSGYLTVDGVEHLTHSTRYKLRVPNEEVHRLYLKTFKELMGEADDEDLDPAQARPNAGSMHVLLDALLSGHAKLFERELSKVLATIASYHDFTGKEPEAIYHAFVMGLIAHLSGTHIIRSNRETGHGRADLMVIPKQAGEPAAILEFKVVRKPEPDELPNDIPKMERGLTPTQRRLVRLRNALAAAVKQMEAREYASELADRDVGAVYRYAVAFHKKRCLVERV